MAIISGTTVNWTISPRVVTIPIAEDSATIEDLQDTLLELEAEEEGIIWKHLRETSGGEALGGGVTVGLTMELQNAQIAFEAVTTPLESGTVTTGGTTTLIDSTATFQTNLVGRGDIVINVTDSSQCTVVSVDSQIQLTTTALIGGSSNDFVISDVYDVYDVAQRSVTGGNLVAVDDVGGELSPIFPTFGTQVVRTAASSATSQNAASIEYASFEGGIWVDVNSSNELGPGENPLSSLIGNAQFPVNNIPDAILIDAARGLPDTIYIIGDIDLTTGDEISNYLIIGQNTTRSNITIADPAVTDGCEFQHTSISGILDGDNILRECVVGNINYFSGYMYDCALTGTITLGGGVAAYLYDCKDGIVGLSGPYIDMGGTGQSIIVSGYGGDLFIQNRTGADEISIGMSDGKVVFGATVSSGTSIVSGTGRLDDKSTGTSVVINELVSGAEIGNIRWLLEMQRPHHTGVGNIWYWNPYDGNDANDGDHVSRAVKTFAQAHTLAVDNNQDVIMAIPGNPSGQTVTTENLTISKNALFLRGPGRNFKVQSTNDNMDAIHISSDSVEVSGMIVSTSATSVEDAVHTEGNFTFLKDLWVTDSVNGVHFDGGDHHIADNVKSLHNLGWGMKFSGLCDHVDIIDCHIGTNYLDNVILDLDPSTHEVNFKGETIIHSSTTGYGLDISAATNGVIIGDNVEVFDNAAGNVHDMGTNTHYGRVYDLWRGVDKSVYLDPEAAVNGIGSQTEPYNDLSDALDYAESKNITTLIIMADIILDRTLKNFTIKGVGVPEIDLNGKDVKNLRLYQVQVKGNYLDVIIVQESVLLPGMYLNGFFENCALAGDLICIDGGQVLLKDCASNIPGLGRPTVSMNGAGSSKLGIRGYDGGMTIKDCNNAADEVTVEMNRGSLTFDSSCTDGTMVARTGGKFVNETNGATVTIEANDPTQNLTVPRFIALK